ncbi:ClpD chaperone, Hsp100 family [Volvox carteri f. nagariensis]|uniref:ClpD chaperone, Hsp100 family n=1 Tax=Volvox carteri f. nagariensis TaxID=3068 RepID=D8TU57_VOLCA|nr:ClpD chaperone, Hsp100 family [Volvox carteri f. nagariensis]EFJ49084.1 ClpD chaperone, Hsp100 family [Volvox carteri f. nagariensis]|eukprot:XP_002949981.1 ClpD chaperone, Hsp100 family [Volvox carteri f. nagariensis]
MGQRPALQLSSKLPRPQRFSVSRRQAVKVQAVFERFTERSIKTVMIAQAEAKSFGHNEVNTEHILLGLVAEESLSKNGYLNSGVTPERAKATVEAIFGRKRPVSHGESIPFSREVRKMFEAATHECKRSNVNWISPEHILLAMLAMPDCNGKRVLHSLSVDVDGLKAEASKRLKGDTDAEQAKKKQAPLMYPPLSSPLSGSLHQASGAKEGPKMTEEYCKDLCAEVRAGRIDPVVGREREVSRVVQILARRTKNNPILLGEPGVGKTAIAEGLASAIVHRTASLDGAPLPEFLHSKRILQLDVGLLIAGAKERGELESRVTKLIAEVKEAGNIILMIDEIHTLVGAGSVGRGGGGGLDIANLVKPALARGEFQVIGATTLDEHRKYIERDAALERRFQPITVDEPTPEATLAILMGLKERYERHHRCAYTEEALAAAVTLSHKYIADRFLPDKAIDLIDEAGSRARIAAFTARQTRSRQQARMASLALSPGSGSGSSSYSRDHPKLHEYLQVGGRECEDDGGCHNDFALPCRELSELAGPSSDGSVLPVVGVEDIEAIVSAWTAIPVEKMNDDEKERLLNMRSDLGHHVVGQEDAVESIATALCRARCGLKDPRRPVASLLFVGPTGVGKTELAKVLSEQYYGSRDALLRLDMSEYMERHSVSKLVGAPPGYVGFGEGGKLTEAIRRRPFSVVLFDEIEKAHPDVFAVLLQILEDGRLTDSQGRTVSFKHAMIILTSNIGSRVIAAGSGTAGGGVGSGGVFSRGADIVGDDDRLAALASHKLKQEVLGEVRSFFSPELLNRFDETVVFQRLRRADVATIAGLMMEETVDRAAERGLQVEVAPPLMEHIIAEGYSEEYGARPLRQAIVRLVDDPLSDAVLHRKFAPGTRLVLSLNSDGVVTARTAEEEEAAAAAVAASCTDLTTSHLAQHPSGVDGGILVSVGPGGTYGSDDGGAASSSRREKVVLTATLEDN